MNKHIMPRIILEYRCSRCGKEIQSANRLYFKKYIQLESVGCSIDFSKFKFREVYPTSTIAEYIIQTSPMCSIKYTGTINGVEINSKIYGSDENTIILCAKCSTEFADLFDDGMYGSTPFGYLKNNPFHNCGVHLDVKHMNNDYIDLED